jgi:thymidylate synthase (FAD)
MARVSNPGNQDSPEGVDKLIRYLIQNEHWSPFEVIHMVFEIKTSRDISRQILRHRSFTFQEFSQRYA